VAEQGGWPGASPLLSGLFGVLQSAAAQRTDTAGTWQALRQAAGSWAWQAAGKGELPDQATLEANGAEILRAQGVGIQQVNTYRAIANQWRTAHENLSSAGQGDQINAGQIFRPPWSQTASGPLPDRYRIKVQWEVTPQTGDPFSMWASYELDSPLTSLDDLLAQAGQVSARKPTSALPLGASITGVTDYDLEQI
jgi:hypothetical protein